MLSYTEPDTLLDRTENHHTTHYRLTILALAIVLLMGILCAVQLAELPPTFAGNVDVAALEQNPDAYDLSNADGAAHVIVSRNLAETSAKNVCFSVVFNFRGYDTMGESFILIAALSGSLCILRRPKHRKAEKVPAEQEENHG